MLLSFDPNEQGSDIFGGLYTVDTGKHKIATFTAEDSDDNYKDNVDHCVVLRGSQDNAGDKRTMEGDDVQVHSWIVKHHPTS